MAGMKKYLGKLQKSFPTTNFLRKLQFAWTDQHKNELAIQDQISQPERELNCAEAPYGQYETTYHF